MSSQQSFPLWHRVPDREQGWFLVCTNCYFVHVHAMYHIPYGVKLSSNTSSTKRVSRNCTAKYYATVPSPYSAWSYWSSGQLHGSPPTYRPGLPPDKDAGCASLLNLPAGRDDPPDKEITYNCMNGSPGDPPDTVVQQYKQYKHNKNRPFHNPSRGRFIRQGGRMGGKYRRYIICH